MNDYQAYGLSDVGRVRQNNEDAMLMDHELGLYIVCDGMGGHAAGEIASSRSCHVIHTVLKKNAKFLQAYADDPNISKRDKCLKLLEHAVQEACRKVYEIGEEDPNKAGLGCTCVLIVCFGHSIILASVGDSRAYLLRNGQAIQITEDHSLVTEQLKKGLLTVEEASKIAYGSVLTRAIGPYPSVAVDTLNMEIMPGDAFVICSDGLTDYVTGREMVSLSDELDLKEVPAALIDLANKRGGKDNITNVVVEFDGKTDPKAVHVQKKIEALKQIPLFEKLDYTELVKLLNILGIESYKAGDQIIQEGQQGEELYVSLAGAVQVQKNGNKIVDLPPGSFFGEMALLDREPRSADIVATEAVKVMVLKRADFFQLLKREYQISQKVLWSFCRVLNERLRNTSSQLSDAHDMLKMNAAAEAPTQVDFTEVASVFDEELNS